MASLKDRFFLSSKSTILPVVTLLPFSSNWITVSPITEAMKCFCSMLKALPFVWLLVLPFYIRQGLVSNPPMLAGEASMAKVCVELITLNRISGFLRS